MFIAIGFVVYEPLQWTELGVVFFFKEICYLILFVQNLAFLIFLFYILFFLDAESLGS